MRKKIEILLSSKEGLRKWNFQTKVKRKDKLMVTEVSKFVEIKKKKKKHWMLFVISGSLSEKCYCKF